MSDDFNKQEVLERLRELFTPVDAPANPADPTDKTPFIIDSDEKLEWVLGLFKTVHEKMDSCQARFDLKLAELEKIQNEIMEKEYQPEMKALWTELNQLKWRFSQDVLRYIQLRLAQSTKKSETFSGFTLGYRKTPDTIEILSSDLLYDWALTDPANEPCVRIETKPVIAEIKKHIKNTGEIPDGVVQIEGQNKLVAKYGGQDVTALFAQEASDAGDSDSK